MRYEAESSAPWLLARCSFAADLAKPNRHVTNTRTAAPASSDARDDSRAGRVVAAPMAAGIATGRLPQVPACEDSELEVLPIERLKRADRVSADECFLKKRVEGRMTDVVRDESLSSQGRDAASSRCIYSAQNTKRVS